MILSLSKFDNSMNESKWEQSEEENRQIYSGSQNSFKIRTDETQQNGRLTTKHVYSRRSWEHHLRTRGISFFKLM